jgi:hypothetical protein
MRELREYEWITTQEGASIATIAASKSLERDAHVWTEVSHFYIQKWEIILRGIGFTWWSWGKAWLATCRLSQLCIVDSDSLGSLGRN